MLSPCARRFGRELTEPARRPCTRMALTKDRSQAAVKVPESEPASPLSSPWILLGAIAILLLAFGWTFLRDPSISAPTGRARIGSPARKRPRSSARSFALA